MNNSIKCLYSKIDESVFYIKNAEISLDIIEKYLYKAKLYHSKNIEFIDKIENLKEKFIMLNKLLETL